jgi:hypothetical protein
LLYVCAAALYAAGLLFNGQGHPPKCSTWAALFAGLFFGAVVCSFAKRLHQWRKDGCPCQSDKG